MEIASDYAEPSIVLIIILGGIGLLGILGFFGARRKSSAASIATLAVGLIFGLGAGYFGYLSYSLVNDEAARLDRAVQEKLGKRIDSDEFDKLTDALRSKNTKSGTLKATSTKTGDPTELHYVRIPGEDNRSIMEFN